MNIYVDKALSLFVCLLLNKLGYSNEAVQERRKLFKMMGKILTGQNRLEHIYVAGSKGEGLTRIRESDLDILSINYRIQCSESRYKIVKHLDYEIPWDFTLISSHCAPGYTFLFLSRQGSSNGIHKLLVPVGNGQLCLSSSLWLDDLEEMFHKPVPGVASLLKVKPRQGPSIPYEQHGGINFDRVSAIFCLCPTILHEWLVRPRRHDWPSWELRVEVILMGANLSPVGCKKNDLQSLDWRTCFNLGEMRLVQSLNETQTKLYILLKMLLKDIIKPENKEITSFMMKNLVFWLCERYPKTEFSLEKLMYWVRRALRMLQESIEVNFLPYYMIPGRNLL